MMRSSRAFAFLRRAHSSSTSEDIEDSSDEQHRPAQRRHSKKSTSSSCDEGTTAEEEEELPGCMICLDPMNASDLAHPLMCSSSACCYNFCCNCIESLIERKQGTNFPFEEDDDSEDFPSKGGRAGNRRIILHCPNCRSDLGPTICDTILLRKVDQALSVVNENDEDIGKRLALKKAMDVDVALLREIAQARDREAQFWEKKFATTSGEQDYQKSDPPEQREEDCDEWGFEVDIRVGTIESIKLPKELFPNSVFESSMVKADRTLLGGLESAIPKEDQEQFTRFLISGDTSELAKAAELLWKVAEAVHLWSDEATVGGVCRGRAIPPELSSPTRPMPRRSSVYNWIELRQKARGRNVSVTTSSKPVPTSSSSVQPYHHNYASHTSLYTVKANKHRLIARQLREKLAYMRRHPLPVRMPKYAEFTIQLDGHPSQLEASQIVKSLPFRFCNDTWDGTVMDAFSKIYVAPKSLKTTRNGKNYAPALPTSTFVDNYEVSRKRQETEGIRNILDGGLQNSSHRGDVRIDISHPRVLIASVVDSQASLQGILKGDVVTHLNGVELRDNTVDDVIALICSLFYSSSNSSSSSSCTAPSEKSESDEDGARSTSVVSVVTLRFVVNADRATAEALKMRAAAPNY